MTFLGADTDQLRGIALRMRMDTMRLREKQLEIVAAVQTTRWEGPDADAFRENARITASRISDVGEELLRRADEALDHAQEQDDVSDPRDFWQKLNDLLYWPAQITRTIRNIQKIITNIPRTIDLIKQGVGDVRRFIESARESAGGMWSKYKDAMKHWDAEFNGKGWEKLGDSIAQKFSKYTGINLPGKEWAGKLLKGLDETAEAAKPWLKTGSKALGKLLPGLDIGLGVHQIVTGDGYDKVSGSLSVASGALVLLSPLAGPAAPIVAGIGIGLGVVSAGMDIGRTLYENVPAFKGVVDGGVKAVGDGINAIGEGLGKVGNAFGSLFA